MKDFPTGNLELVSVDYFETRKLEMVTRWWTRYVPFLALWLPHAKTAMETFGSAPPLSASKQARSFQPYMSATMSASVLTINPTVFPRFLPPHPFHSLPFCA